MQEKMPKIFVSDTKEINYFLCKSKRARRVRIVISFNSGVVVTIPWLVPEGFAERFVAQKADWILRSMEKIKQSGPAPITTGGKREYVRNRGRAYNIVLGKLQKFNVIYNFKYSNVYIRNQKTRWGSCSRNGNLSFNYRLVFLPDHLIDYLVVHELCHLGELNHSERFWKLVAMAIPDYKKMRRELKGSRI